MGIASDLVLIVLTALVGGLAARACHQPVIIGFILAGIVVGPYTGGPTVEHLHDIQMLAEVGVALLLFTIGLEFSFAELRRLAKISFGATPLQIVLCMLACVIAGALLGLPRADALWLGGAVALSSTMVVMKSLASRDALDSEAGRIMLAVLIAQDIAVVPLIIILPQLSGSSIDVAPLAWALGKSALFLAIMYLTGTRLFPRLFSWIGRLGSNELFFVATLSIALGAGYISHAFGLSFALGAFAAGMLLSETDFNHQALSDVSGLRDLFGLIFFVSVGMLFNPDFFFAHIGVIFLGTVLLVVLKALLVAGPLRLSGFGVTSSLVAGLGLAQVGEFAFVVATTGQRVGQLSHDSFAYMISVGVLSMVLTPSLLWAGSFVPALFRSGEIRDLTEVAPRDEVGHILIVGGGVVGVLVARTLETLGKPYLLVERDYRKVTHLRAEGFHVLFGDATHRAVLEAAAIRSASLVVVASTRDGFLSGMVATMKSLAPHVSIVARVQDIESAVLLPDGAVQELVQPQKEVALEMIRQSLVALKIIEPEITATLEALRQGQAIPHD
jgi:CPA2 family monovalent cation:H+ antiporter-2